MTEETPEPTVFVVEDDPGVREAVRLLLWSVGLPVRTYPSAAGFLSEFNSQLQGCLILDLRMPGMSGRELQEELNRRNSTLPIIFVTAQGELSTAVDAVKAGAVDFIQKPFREEKLLERVNEALALNARQRGG